MIVSSGNMMGQEFRQGCTDGLLHTMSWGHLIAGSWRLVLVQQGQRVSGTHLHYVGVTERQGSARRFIHRMQPPVPAPVEPDFLHEDPGPARERTWKPPISEDWAQIWHTSSLLPYSHCQYQPRLQKKNSVKESVAYLYLLLWESKKCALWIFVSRGQKSARSTRTKLEKDSHLES